MKSTRAKSSKKVRHGYEKNFVLGFFILAFATIGATLLILSQAATALNSVKSGSWNDPTVWGGRVPGSGDIAIINSGHSVIFDAPTTRVAGVRVNAGGTLTFKSDQSTTLESTENILVEGRLEMKPNSPSVKQLIRFTGINEQSMVGGGMDPIASDKGLWVTGSGKLDIVGSERSGWLRANAGLNAGATSVTLESAPVGWQVGDEVTVTPTEAPTTLTFNDGFDVKTITAISGSTITLNSGLNKPHPKVNNLWTAEVANLTRNVNIEGTSTGRTHIFVRSNTPQTVNYLGIRYIGPRSCCNGDGFTEFVLGRYGLHFHMANEGSRGTQVFGTVVRDGGSHAFVPHKSHGIHFKDTVVFNTTEDAYWWDMSSDTRSEGDETHDTVYDHAMAALIKYEPSYRGYRLTGFSLPQGLRNTIRDSVAVGVQGSTDASGFGWPESAGASKDSTVWNFSKGNVAHNNLFEGLFVWQNNREPHVVSNFVSYHNGEYGIQHGAYGNNYHYENAHLYGNGVAEVYLQATGDNPEKQRWDNMIMDGAGLNDYLIISEDHTFNGTESPTIIRNSVFKNAKKAVALNTGEGRAEPDSIDFEFPSIQNVPADVILSNPPLTSVFRVQKTGASIADKYAPEAITAQNPNGKTSTPLFAPASTPDLSRPQLQILTPVGGSTISGTAQFNMHYYDMGTITKVDIYVDNLLRGTVNGTPATIQLNTSGLGSGPHNFHMQATDSVGRSNRSAIVTYNVQGGDPYVTPTPPASDTVKPYVDLFTPDKNETISGYVAVTSEAWDNFGISKVEFYKDNSLIYTDTTYPYEFVWNTWKVPNASGLSIWAKAYDFNGNTEIDDYAGDISINNTTSEPADTQPPDVNITAPSSGATVSGNINVSASAVDNLSISKVEFYVDGTLKNTDSSPPYNFLLDTTQISNAQHLLTAKAFDPSNNSRTSSIVNITVNNGGSTPPPTVRPEDINQDGMVNILDFSLLAAKFGQSGSNLGRSDINQDGVVNILDFSLLAAKFGT